MAKKKLRHASVEAQAWIRHFSALLLATKCVPDHMSKVLLIPETTLHNRWLLSRAEGNLGLWAFFYKPLTPAQTWTRHLAVYVELNHELRNREIAYIVHACATASATRLKEIYQELTLTGQLVLPAEFTKKPHSSFGIKTYDAFQRSELFLRFRPSQEPNHD